MLLQANFSKRQMQLEVGIDTQYLFATLNDVRRVEGRCSLCMDDGVGWRALYAGSRRFDACALIFNTNIYITHTHTHNMQPKSSRRAKLN